jgi:dTDP-4-dehydrorhamnose 3,5-epimerase
MKIFPLGLGGCFLLSGYSSFDNRGTFVKHFSSIDFSGLDLNTDWHEYLVTKTDKMGTFRGLHLQVGSGATHKLVTCLSGAVYDVLLDLREESPSYLKWIGFELESDSNQSIYIPPGVAHGFQSLKPNTLMSYLISKPFLPHFYRGINYSDPKFNVTLPLQITDISKQDLDWPFFTNILTLEANHAV